MENTFKSLENVWCSKDTLEQHVSRVIAVFDAESRIPFGVELKENLMSGICKNLIAAHKDGKMPSAKDIEWAFIQWRICEENYHAGERCQGYATIAAILASNAVVNNVKTTLDKHKCVSGTYKDVTRSVVSNDDLFKKWGHRIGTGWYGFQIGGCPENWHTAVDEILEYLTSFDETLVIQQIKLKFGGCRFYTDSKYPYILYVERVIESALFDNSLIW